MKRLRAAFPGTPDAFFAVLADMLHRDAFTAQRLRDAVDRVLHEYKYPTLIMSEILGYDRRQRFYHHAEVVKMIDEGFAWDDFQIVKENGSKPKWVLR